MFSSMANTVNFTYTIHLKIFFLTKYNIHKYISTLSNNNTVTMSYFKHRNKKFQQLGNSQKFIKYSTGSHPDPSISQLVT